MKPRWFMKVLLILPAGENVRVTRERPRVPKRAMLWFSVLPLTTVAAGTRGELLRTSHCWLDAGIVRGETRVDLSPRQQARTASSAETRQKVLLRKGARFTNAGRSRRSREDKVMKDRKHVAWLYEQFPILVSEGVCTTEIGGSDCGGISVNREKAARKNGRS